MPGLPDAFAGSVLDFVTNRGVAPTYLVLLKSDPGVNPVMTSLDEVTDAGYARQLITYAVPTLSPRGTSNTALFTYGPFPAGTATPASYVALVDAATGLSGLVRYTWMLDGVMSALVGESIQFPQASMTLGW